MLEQTLTLSQQWESLTLANNFIFCKVMESNPDLCKHLIEILLNIEIEKLEAPQSERTFQESISSKGVRFDVYTKDSKRIFDVEIQTVNKKNLPKRSRYYQSVIDVSNLNAGVNYSELKETYIIFICLNDPFGKKFPVYSYENICVEDGKTKLNDGTHKVFFNAGDCDKLKSEEQKTFFDFLKGKSAGDDFTRLLEEKVLLAKQNLEWRNQYMTFKEQFQEEFEEARAQGYDSGHSAGVEEGASEKACEIARNFLRLNTVPVEQIAQAVSLPLEDVLALKKELESEK